MIVGTAGHIDHGKTALVKALTGVDADRLAEEKARGITIDLGFAYADLGGGAVTGFVDVPGHERLIHTMLAGAGGIDFALLVVAADDGVMPQTREHLAILDLLGLGRGLVALSKADLADAPRRRAVADQIRLALAGTALAEAPVLAVSALTGEGIADLRAALIAA
ncbi:GTP-binding protein, partial [Xinfangfangia pollutisoli]|uniref:GTP-binding protein n=1 Tax=Xinfangfangia pollutisoli TaxID=2865960 RepID=UPI0021E53F20